MTLAKPRNRLPLLCFCFVHRMDPCFFFFLWTKMLFMIFCFSSCYLQIWKQIKCQCGDQLTFFLFLLFNCRLSTWCTCPIFGFLLCIFDRWAAFQRANVAPGLQQLENFTVQWASKRIWCHGVTVWRLKLLYVGVSVFRKELQLSTEESEAIRACMLFQRCNMFYSNIY